jgi:hypothetical protein
MKRCRLKRYDFQNINKMSKENKTSDKQENGNDFIADVSTRFYDVYYETNNKGFFGGGRTSIKAESNEGAINLINQKIQNCYRVEVLNVC